MEDYNAQNNKFIKNGLVIIERVLTEIERLRIDRITDSLLLKTLDFFKTELEKIKTTIIRNPRFDWVNIQEEIDDLYRRDPNLTGMILYIDWKDGGNRGFYKYKIPPKS
ncbi:hypothetical protein [Polaribacter sp. R77954]|uniref:hypothetical protein n=1 Tax=Polaribacter sp. R77954 TaxID=3093870 RepID=UPI0037CC0A19